MVVTIDVGSKDDAQLLAASLPGGAEASFFRGYGIVRMRHRHESEVPALLPIVADCVERHRIRWARVRFGDEERTFRSAARDE